MEQNTKRNCGASGTFSGIEGRALRRRACLGAAVVLLCAFWAGCGERDRALAIPLGETVAEDSQIQAPREDLGGQAEVSASTGSPNQAQAAASAADSASGTAAQNMIYVHVCGAVNSPGVVELPEGSRAQAALEAAGGFAEDAAEDAVNLAEVLRDGVQLYFPTKEESVAWVAQQQEESEGLVNLNTAGVETLCTLPGIGEAKAKAIVAYREANGAFECVEDIMQVSGIKEGAYNQIKDLVVVR
ncbi:MAG: helix-hairpin-helix domain-containing protein [Butyrivibrio sp.]|nr:helix-hairpin-helix domain-containing protein [Muribaculum sp.]MCM1552903.1 helix-hairpin-helix domain-containing protein [Butyrivibrio sp.]